MGLDIHAWSQAEKVEHYDACSDDSDVCACSDELDVCVAYVISPEFHASLAGLDDGSMYRGSGEEAHFSASYSGYNRLRDAISLAGIGVGARQVWGDAERHSEHPLFPLVNFADNEGTIGPLAAARIHEGLTATGVRDLVGGASTWTIRQFDDLVEVFRVGSTGMVVFR